MKFLHIFIGLTVAATVPAQIFAAPTGSAAVSKLGQSATVPFLPPLDTPLRYRWEKSVQKVGETDISWSTSDFRFEEHGEGYRLTVTPVSSGSNETDPDRLALEKKLEALLNHPIVLRLDASGQIEMLEKSDEYWSTISRVLREEIDRLGANSSSPKVRQALGAVIEMFEKMPQQARLALLTESIQPLLEFGDTKTEIGKPMASAVEGPSPFGGTIKYEVVVSLTDIVDQTARISVRTAVPRAELERLIASFLKQIARLEPDKQASMKSAMASFAKFRHEKVVDYRLSIQDGMLEKFRSTETIEAANGTKSEARVTTRTLDLIP